MSFIAGAGTTNIDLIYKGIEKLPEVGEEVYSKGFEIQLGGGIPATLINLSRLGIKTKLATELGDDIFSEFAKEKYLEYSVTPVNMNKGDEIPVNITSAIILPDDRSFISYGKGNVEPDDETKEAFYMLAKGSKITIMQPSGFLDVYKKLKNDGTILVLDTGWDDEMSIEKYGDYLSVANYYTPNRKEAMKITNTATPYEAAEKLKDYFDKVVVKLDKDGCIGIDKELFTVPALKNFNCIDSTGAGDAFLAGFIYGLYYDYKLKDCIRFGNITGGKCVTAHGALSAYVNENELIEIYKKAVI
ncbi:MAG: carbohydrate kinase family protein [Eubacterium sp.]|nr:carbohydrate kinase family protein [Eubacterium sp.]